MVLTHSLLYTHPASPLPVLPPSRTTRLLSRVGDALGYRNQLWEYNDSEPAIHQVGNLEMTQEDGSLDPNCIALFDFIVK